MKKTPDLSAAISKSASEAADALEQAARLVDDEWRRLRSSIDESEHVPDQVKAAFDRFDTALEGVRKETSAGAEDLLRGLRQFPPSSPFNRWTDHVDVDVDGPAPSADPVLDGPTPPRSADAPADDGPADSTSGPVGSAADAVDEFRQLVADLAPTVVDSGLRAARQLGFPVPDDWRFPTGVEDEAASDEAGSVVVPATTDAVDSPATTSDADVEAPAKKASAKKSTKKPSEKKSAKKASAKKSTKKAAAKKSAAKKSTKKASAKKTATKKSTGTPDDAES